MIAQHCECGAGVTIAPSNAREDFVTDDHVPIYRRPFPLAEGASRGAPKYARRDRIRPNVVAWRVACFERPDAGPRVDDDRTVMLDQNMRSARLSNRRAGKCPHAALAGAHRVGGRPHAAFRFATCRRRHRRSRRNARWGCSITVDNASKTVVRRVIGAAPGRNRLSLLVWRLAAISAQLRSRSLQPTAQR